METNAFILALSKTLPESCLQGFIVYLVLQLLFLCYKRSTPVLKFNLFYAANLFLFVGFLILFFHHYEQVSSTSFNPRFLPAKIGTEIAIINTQPNLLMRIDFWISNYAYLITSFYLLGLFFCMLRLVIGIINISWFKNNKHLKLDDYLTKLSIQLSTNFSLIKTVSVYLSDRISVPLTIGFIKPIIVFPIALVNRLSAEQTEAILLHELAHIKRDDYLMNVLLNIIQSFLFFNPAVWMMKREINKYREQCCDDLVLDKTSHKIAYARALLLIEESRSTQILLALTSNGKKYNLLNRIKRITNMKTNTPSPQNKLVVLLLAFIVIGLTVAWNMPVKEASERYTLHKVKFEETKLNGSQSETRADKIEMVKKKLKNPFRQWVTGITSATVGADSNITMFTDNITYRPNKKLNRKFIVSGKELVFRPWADTIITSKNKFKIVLEDENGNKKEYNSIDDLPTADQNEFLKQNAKLHPLHDFNSLDLKIDTSEIAFIKKHFNSPEWKKEMADIRKQGVEIRKQFNSPEWKKQMADIRKQGLEIRKQFNSPEWKKQMADIRKQSEVIRKQFTSSEWKKQMEDLKKMAMDSGKRNWEKSPDEEHRFATPEKAGEPKEL